MPPEVKRKAVDPAGAAAALGLHIDSIYRMISAGELPAVKVRSGWRIRVEAIDALLARGSQPKQPTVDDLVAEIVAASPPLTDEQVDRIVAIIEAAGGAA